MKMLLLIGVVFGLVLGGCAARTSGAEPGTEPTPADGEVTPAEPAEEPTAEDPTEGEGDNLEAESTCTPVDASLPLAERCAAAGAEVHEFTNTCVGKCKAMEEMMMCGQAMTEGCKCPEGQCIDDETGCCRAIRR